VFAEVWPISHQEWLDGFQRDRTPENEVAIWEQVAWVYTAFLKENELTAAGRNEAYELLLFRSRSANVESRISNLSHLTIGQAKSLLALYGAPPFPGGLVDNQGRTRASGLNFSKLNADVTVHNDRGSALAQKGDLDGAILEYRTALRLDPNHPVVHINLGNALYEKGDSDGAIAELETAIGLNPDAVAAHFCLGNALGQKGDVAGAIREYRKTLRLNPNHVGTHVNLGLLLQILGNKNEAREELRQGLALLEEVPGSRNHVEAIRDKLRELE